MFIAINRSDWLYLFVVCMLLLDLAFPGCLRAGDEPFTYPSNTGITGLMEMPTARVMKEGKYRVGVSQADPYRQYYLAIGLFDGFEVDGRVTEIMLPTNYDPVTNPGPGSSGLFGHWTDKVFDLKYQFIQESKYLPAMALGIMDPQGSKTYAGQYLVVSKQIYPFDFTFGFGNGRFGKRALPPSEQESIKVEMFSDPNGWLKDGQFFWGVQYAYSDQIAFMLEYSPIKYEIQKDYGNPFQGQSVSSQYNFGVRLKPWDWLETDLTYQRGNQIGLNFSMNFDLGKPFIPIFDRPYKESPALHASPLAKRIIRALHESGFSDIGVTSDGGDLYVEAANNKYYYTMRAVGVAFRAIGNILAGYQAKGSLDLPFSRNSTIHLILTENGIPVLEFATAIGDLDAFHTGQLTAGEFFQLSDIMTDITETPDMPKSHRNYFDYVLKPDFKMFLNDPSGFFKYRFGVAGDVHFMPWNGSTLALGLVGYPLNTVSSVNEPSSTPVRTDIVAYKEQNVEMGMLLFNHIHKFSHDIHGKVAVGYLEEEYAGLDWEVAKPLFGGLVMAGLSGSIVKKRDPENFFRLKKDDWKDEYVTGFFNLRLNLPGAEMNIDLKNGQFLAGDRGTVISVSKNFNGIVLSAWYSFTGTDVFEDAYNKGYHDKGIAISIPLRFFSGKDSKSSYSMGISPWTRDVAQDINHFINLFDFIGRNVRIYLDKDKGMLQ